MVILIDGNIYDITLHFENEVLNLKKNMLSPFFFFNLIKSPALAKISQISLTLKF